MFGRKPNPTRKPTAQQGFRPAVEYLEARDCAALFVWTGKYGSAYGYPTSEGTGGNWLAGSDWYSLSVPSAPPSAPDDVWFHPDYVVGSSSCQWGPAASTIKSLHMVKGAGGAAYPGTVQIPDLTLSNGLGRVDESTGTV